MLKKPNNKKLITLPKNAENILDTLANGSEMDHRVHDIIYDLFLLEDFESFVTETRKRLGIPKNGFDLNHLWFFNDTIYELETQEELPKVKAILKRLKQIDKIILNYLLTKKYFFLKLSNHEYTFRITSIIENNILFQRLSETNDPVGEIGYEERPDGKDKIKIVFNSDIRKKEATSFIERSYFKMKEIGRVINLHAPLKQKIKIRKNLSRDVHIYNTHCKIIEERKSRTDEVGYIANELKSRVNKKLCNGLSRSSILRIAEKLGKKRNDVNQNAV